MNGMTENLIIISVIIVALFIVWRKIMKRQLAGIVTLVVTGGTSEYAIGMHNLNAGIAGIILGIIGILFVLGSGE